MAIVLAMLAVSCSSDTEDGRSSPGLTSEFETESVADDSQPRVSAAETTSDSPPVTVDEGEIPQFSNEEAAAVVAVLGWDEAQSNSRQAALDAYNTREVQTQELVGQCMRALGFDYELDSAQPATLISPPDTDRGTREFAEDFGFGMSTLVFGADVVSPAIGYENSWFDEPPRSTELNDESAGTDDAERRAFDDALFGPDRQSGCIGDAASDLAPAEALVEGAAERIQVIEDRAAADPERLDYLEELTACIAQPDFELESMDSFDDFLTATMVAHDIVGPDVTAVSSEAWITRLVEVQAIELELATAFYDCAGGEAEFANTLFDLAEPYRQPILDLLED